MKIIQLHSENIKRLKVVDITPTDNVVVVSGKNGAGKTSTIDSIWLALEYKAAKRGNPTPLRAGQDKGFVEIDLGEYIVTRKFTQTGSSLEIRRPDGSKMTSPQKLLDGFIGDLSFDPWEFSRKNERDQREMLADVLYSVSEGKVDLAEFDLKHKELYEKRSDTNKEKKRLQTLLTQLAPPTADVPTEERSSAELSKKLSEAIKLQNGLELLTNREESLLKELEEVRKQIAEHPAVPDVQQIQKELNEVESSNKKVREAQNYFKIKKGLNQVEEEIQKLNDEMELIDIEKAEALEQSPLPVQGLRITENGIMVINEEEHEVPFCQASAAQQLRFSLAIAMAANPTLRVIRIADGSLLDDTSMDILKEMADAQDYQVWVEYASRNDDDRMGVYIEDGVVSR